MIDAENASLDSGDGMEYSVGFAPPHQSQVDPLLDVMRRHGVALPLAHRTLTAVAKARQKSSNQRPSCRTKPRYWIVSPFPRAMPALIHLARLIHTTPVPTPMS